MAKIGQGQLSLMDMNDVVASTTAPQNPIEGTMWFNTLEGKLYIYTNGQWVFSADGVEAGRGRNYVLNSNFSRLLDNWYPIDYFIQDDSSLDESQIFGENEDISVFFEYVFGDDGGDFNLNVSREIIGKKCWIKVRGKTGSQFVGVYQNLSLEQGQEYLVSFKAYKNLEVGGNFKLYLGDVLIGTTVLDYESSAHNFKFTATTNEQVPLKIIGDSSKYEFYMTEIKIEKGNMSPTDWTPAPEDTEDYLIKAQADADLANESLADISSDDKLSPSEKLYAKKEWEIISEERLILETQADTYSLVTEKINFQNAFYELKSYIVPLLDNTVETSDIVGEDFRNKFKLYYEARVILLSEISEYTKTTMDDISDSIYEIEATLGNMASDSILDYQERQVIKDKLTAIVGLVMTDVTATMPLTTTLETSLKGGFYNTRKSALNAGILVTEPKYIAVATRYNELKTYLDAMTPVKPWDVSVVNKALNITVVKDTFRTNWLNYYIAIDELSTLTAEQLKKNVDNVSVGGRNLLKTSDKIAFSGISPAYGTISTSSINITTATSFGAWIALFSNLSTYFQENTENIISVDVKVSNASIGASSLEWQFRNASTYKSATTIITDTPVNTWVRKSITIPALPTSTLQTMYLYWFGAYPVGTVIQFRNPKIERGNKATDWTPAPEDIDAQIAGLTTAIDVMSDDDLLDITERKIIKDRISDISGFVIGDTTPMSTVSVLDASLKGEFYSVRKSALNAGISTSDAKYINVATKYSDLKGYLEGTTDVTPPSEVTALAETHTHNTARLTWTNPVNVDFSHTRIYNGAVLIQDNNAQNLCDITGLAVSTAYTFKVVTVDLMGNASVGVTKAVTTNSAPDVTPPNNATSVTVGSITHNAITMSWVNPVSDFATNEVYNGTTLVNSNVTGTSFQFTGLTASTAYVFKVISKDASGNKSTGVTVNGTTSATPDTTPPADVTSLTSPAKSTTTVDLSWVNPTSDFASNEVYNGAVLVNGFVTGTTYQITGLTASTAYTFKVISKDASGNKAVGATVSVTTNAVADVTPPNNVTSLTNTVKTNTTATLTWVNPVSDFATNEVWNGAVLVNANIVGTTYQFTGLTASTSYTFKVISKDASGNKSTGATIVVVTNAPPDTTAPDVVTNLSAISKTSTTVNLQWANPTAVDFGYHTIYMNNVEIDNGDNANFYNFTGLTPNTLYTFKIVSVDTTGNANVGASLAVTTDAVLVVSTIQPTATIGKDTQASSTSPSENGGNYQMIKVGYSGTLIFNDYFEFPLSSVPANSIITSASLELYKGGYWATGSNTYEIRRVTSSWSESTLTYSSQPTVDSLVEASKVLSNTDANGYYAWNIKSLVQKWVSGTSSNFGLRISSPANTGGIELCTSDYVGYEPKLIITYEQAGTDTTPPANVTSLSAVPNNNTTITLYWTNPTSDFSYNKIMVHNTLGGLRNRVGGNETGTILQVTGLNPSTFYYFTVISVDASGNESAGVTTSITTPSGGAQMAYPIEYYNKIFKSLGVIVGAYLPWNTSDTYKGSSLTVDKTEFRTKWINYYVSVQELINATTAKLNDRLQPDAIASSLSITPSAISLISQNINISGNVTFSALETLVNGWTTVGQTTINGSMIQTGTINASKISGGTISGNMINGGTITGTTISGITINGGSISGTDITGANITGTSNIIGATITGGTINVTTDLKVGNSIELGTTGYGVTKAIKFNGITAWIYSDGDNITLSSAYIMMRGRTEFYQYVDFSNASDINWGQNAPVAKFG